MAYSLESKFEVSDYKQLQRRLSRVSSEAADAVKESNKHWAKALAERIARNAPRLSGKARAKQGSKHRTRPGALGKAVYGRATADSAAIVASARRAPHFYALEFGGGVNWYNSTGHRHRIGVMPRSPSVKSMGLFDRSGVTQRGAAGWFFFPTLRRHEKEYVAELVKAADRAIHEALARG